MFLLNVIPGIFVCTIVYLYGHFDQPNYKLLKNFDLPGVVFMVTALSSMQYVLEEGNKKGWLDDMLIISLIVLMAVSFIAMIIREFTFINPILDLTAFANKNFTFGCVYSFVVGIGLYGAVYLLPLFLFSVAGFNTVQIGMTMMVTGAAQFLSAPIAGKLFGKGMDLRLMLGIGLCMFSLGCYTNSFLTPDSRYYEFFVSQIIRGMSLMFCFIPTNNVALGTIPKDKVHNASGLYNLTRNLGGAIGLAAISTALSSKSTIYTQYINEGTSNTSIIAINQLEMFQKMLTGKVLDPEKGAYMLISNMVSRDAFVIAINEIFTIIAILFVCATIFLLFTTNVKASSDEPSH